MEIVPLIVLQLLSHNVPSNQNTEVEVKAIPAAIIAAGIGIGGFIASLPLAALGVAILLFAHGEKKRPKNKRR